MQLCGAEDYVNIQRIMLHACQSVRYTYLVEPPLISTPNPVLYSTDHS